MTAHATVKGAKRKKIVKIVLIISFIFVGFVGYGIYWAFFDMKSLPTGEYVTEETSPDGAYTLKAYVTSTSLSADAVRGELVFNERKGKTKIFTGIIGNQQPKSSGWIIKQFLLTGIRLKCQMKNSIFVTNKFSFYHFIITRILKDLEI